MGLLNVAGYFDPLLTQLDQATDEGFITPKERSVLVAASTAEELLDELRCRAELIARL